MIAGEPHALQAMPAHVGAQTKAGGQSLAGGGGRSVHHCDHHSRFLMHLAMVTPRTAATTSTAC